MQQSTAPAFAIIESLVTAFTSLAQLVESTYMATHSSFFAMVGVADQLGSVKTYLGQVLGVFSILRLGRRIINWLRGKKTPPNADGWANEWSTALAGGGMPGAAAPRPSAKPLILFLLSAVGLPYLMSRLVKLLIANQQQQQQQQAAANGQVMDANGMIDPAKLTFARARWEFRPSEEWELGLQPDEIVAVLERREGQGANDGWWRGRTRDGRMGWFPGNYVSRVVVVVVVVVVAATDTAARSRLSRSARMRQAPTGCHRRRGHQGRFQCNDDEDEGVVEREGGGGDEGCIGVHIVDL